jgi:hypothetical protein
MHTRNRLLHAALADGIERAHLVDFVAEELDADGVFLTGRVNVHQVAARGGLSASFDHLHALVPRGHKPLDQRARFERVPDRKAEFASGKRPSGREHLHERGGAGGDDTGRAVQQRGQAEMRSPLPSPEAACTWTSGVSRGKKSSARVPKSRALWHSCVAAVSVAATNSTCLVRASVQQRCALAFAATPNAATGPLPPSSASFMRR